jgi:hypothetical protein
LLKADYQDYEGVLKKFLTFINESEIICDYISDCGLPLFDVETEFNKVAHSPGRIRFDMGETSKDEVANIFGILRYVVEKDINILTIMCSYTHSTKYQDAVKAINYRIFFVFIRHIGDYLTKIGIDMGIDENVRYNITVTNGLVNVANDNATINATINNGVNQSELLRLINEVRSVISPELSAEVTESVKGSLEIIESELKLDEPQKRYCSISNNGTESRKVNHGIFHSSSYIDTVRFGCIVTSRTFFNTALVLH